MAKYVKPGPDAVMWRAYVRDGDLVHYDEAMMLACLVHTGGSRQANARQVQAMMHDQNLDGGKRGKAGEKGS